ncbi:MAG: response regulator [Kiritimatiellae bacterium]|nr:response regulator [Kiritimatiellia bacterium]MDD5522538.1 response regulator [Kiritimatiellia bacterium]
MEILVIDDDTRLLEEVRRILTSNGHLTDCVDNADDAVTILGSNLYDFVLVDYRMPKHDGLWFMRNAPLPRHTKTLLVTSYVDRNVIKQMFNAGISGYVVKPFDENELLRHMEFHSNNHKNLQNINPKEV